MSPRVRLVAQLWKTRTFEMEGNWTQVIQRYQSALEAKGLCTATAGVAPLWVQALRSIGPALEKAGRAAESRDYRQRYAELRPSSEGCM